MWDHRIQRNFDGDTQGSNIRTLNESRVSANRIAVGGGKIFYFLIIIVFCSSWIPYIKIFVHKNYFSIIYTVYITGHNYIHCVHINKVLSTIKWTVKVLPIQASSEQKNKEISAVGI